ncbi:SWIM zinc finger family protein [Almyronema epifaneia]|uniref:SWIM zinc finger family protein n=1 Tax=Almyronema epifaneia S1 TaxID=2991925 RepID=A0ABW6IFL3_9CYAN
MTSYQPTQAADYNMEEEAWWVQQWVDLLNSYRFKKRLERGRRYAREGHILSLDFAGAKVSAKVQGTAPEPYDLSIWIDPFTEEDWNYVVDTLAEKAIFSAQLLAGEMPLNIEAVFTANGLNLFPFSLSDVHSRCSCPDPKNPCKHIAAVYYQLGDFFREDPFVIFQLRGRTKAQILEALRQRRRQTATEVSAETPAHDDRQKMAVPDAQPLELDQFWQYNQPLDPSMVVITPAESTVLENLGTIPLPAGEAQAVMAYLRGVYQSVAQQAMMKALS